MADEESEIRRMAEIADAINAILEAEPDAVGDTPSLPANPQTSESTPADSASLDAADAPQDMPQDNTTPENASADPVTDELDAAIAAEFSEAPTPDTDPFGPTPALDLPGISSPNHAIDQNVRSGSEMADLSMRMQDTLAEIRNQSSVAWAGADDLLAEMETARAELVGDIRGQISQIEQATQARRQAVLQQLEELESQSLMARDEMEMLLVKYEASLTEMHNRYFQNAQSERDRLARYREFLQFLLDERGM